MKETRQISVTRYWCDIPGCTKEAYGPCYFCGRDICTEHAGGALNLSHGGLLALVCPAHDEVRRAFSEENNKKNRKRWEGYYAE